MQGSRYLGEYDDSGGARDLGHPAVHHADQHDERGRHHRLHERVPRDPGRGRWPGCSCEEPRFSAAELIMESARQGLRIREVPVHIQTRSHGESKKPRRLGYPIGYLGDDRSHLAPVTGSALRPVETGVDGATSRRSRRRSPGSCCPGSRSPSLLDRKAAVEKIRGRTGSPPFALAAGLSRLGHRRPRARPRRRSHPRRRPSRVTIALAVASLVVTARSGPPDPAGAPHDAGRRGSPAWAGGSTLVGRCAAASGS